MPSISTAELDRLAVTSAWLRKEREFSFYGDIDFIPTEQYDATVAMRAIEGARECVAAATRVIVV